MLDPHNVKTMKLEVRTLKGTHFYLSVRLIDTMADVKKNIEEYWGRLEYPAERQVLLCRGQVLDDDTTVFGNDLYDVDAYVVIMLGPRRVSPPPSPPPSSSTAVKNALDQEPSLDELPPVTDVPPRSPPALTLEFAQSPDRRPQPNANPLNLFPQSEAARERRRVKGLERVVEAMLQLTLSREDEDALDRLQARSRFNRALAMEAYFACRKDEEMAASYLEGYRRHHYGSD